MQKRVLWELIELGLVYIETKGQRKKKPKNKKNSSQT